jgi:hypothetical protein
MKNIKSLKSWATSFVFALFFTIGCSNSIEFVVKAAMKVALKR